MLKTVTRHSQSQACGPNCWCQNCMRPTKGKRALAQFFCDSRDTIFRFPSASGGIEMKQVILNADDFGLTRGVNEGIIRAHREGILTSAKLMANGPAFDDAIERAKANPKLG